MYTNSKSIEYSTYKTISSDVTLTVKLQLPMAIVDQDSSTNGVTVSTTRLARNLATISSKARSGGGEQQKVKLSAHSKHYTVMP